jgi:MFS family permease
MIWRRPIRGASRGRVAAVAIDVREVLASVRSLLGGGAAFIIGNSLLGIALPLRMQAAGYPVGLIGIIMTAYYAGLALGSVYGKQVILRVGHIRAFAVFAAVTAATALTYPLAFAALAWLVLRLVNGFCIAGLTATIESWLNERSTNTTRGRILGLYMVAHYLAVACGQLLVNLGDVAGSGLFMLASGLIGLSLVPVALTRLGAPALDGHRPLSVRELYTASPVGVVGAGVAGILVGSFYALGVVFARNIGLSVTEASLFMSMVVLGGFSFQWPIGMLADRHDRRLVLSAVLAAAGISWPLLAGLSASGLPLVGLLMLALLFGGAISSVYPICVAQTFDRLERKHYVAAAGRLLLCYAVGAAVGPLLTSTLMAVLGPYSFFAFESVLAVSFAGFVVYRVHRRPAVPVDEQEAFSVVPSETPITTDLDPRTGGNAGGPSAAESQLGEPGDSTKAATA